MAMRGSFFGRHWLQRSHQAQTSVLRNATTKENGVILEAPRRGTRFGLLKVVLTITTGLSLGAWVSKKFAAFLEENELFVPEDDDDDDD